jgi:hypothetical protein
LYCILRINSHILTPPTLANLTPSSSSRSQITLLGPASVGAMSNVRIVQDGFNREDPLSTLKLVTSPIPKPSPGQVVVQIKLRNIHVYDFIVLRGPGVANGTPGCEGYGIIHEVCAEFRQR